MYYFIEPMTEDDIAEVQEIEAQSFPSTWSATTYKRELRNTATNRYLVVRMSSTPPPPHPENTPNLRRHGILNHIMSAFFPSTHETTQQYPIIGYGGVWLTVDDAHITTIAVDPRYRGSGVGELLLNGLIDAAYDLEAKMLTLEVRVSNTVAQRLYVKYGFLPGGTRRRYYTDNGEDALIMWTERIDTPEYQALLSELRRQLYTRLQQQVTHTNPKIMPAPEFHE
ncbi:ribosomal protein S18-alanine N-acetyltransferase [Candidatus Oscillochloris fontis]|uniref:ribosomal protein S18-alanine N-acetyltransferase n=1 Tax=Candidatus Oscillochloris fontis TaxID=2496868 RepID=UPI00101D7FBE|nr:ribosomal protein S18-alanine N-acetyltransferase [Candidatus Oscillochloris fontis]